MHKFKYLIYYDFIQIKINNLLKINTILTIPLKNNK